MPKIGIVALTSSMSLWARLALLLSAANCAVADTISGLSASYRGAPTITDVIVSSRELDKEHGTVSVVYYELVGGRLIYQRYLSGDKNITVTESRYDERMAMFRKWRESGWAVSFTDKNSRRGVGYNLAVRVEPPPGKTFVSGQEPPPRDYVMFSPSDGSEVRKVLLESIAGVNFTGRTPLTITLRDGGKLEGDFAPIEFSGAICGQRFQAFDRYGPQMPIGIALNGEKTNRIEVEGGRSTAAPPARK